MGHCVTWYLLGKLSADFLFYKNGNSKGAYLIQICWQGETVPMASAVKV